MREATPRMVRRTMPTFSGTAGTISVTVPAPFASCASCAKVLSPCRRQRFLLGRVDIEDPVEAGYLEDACDAGARSHEPQRAALLLEPLDAADQDAQPRGIQILHLRQVDQQVLRAPVDLIDDRLPQERRRVDIHLSFKIERLRRL